MRIILSAAGYSYSAPFEIGFESKEYAVNEMEGNVSVCVMFIVPGEADDTGVGDTEVDIYIFSTTSLESPAASKMEYV